MLQLKDLVPGWLSRERPGSGAAVEDDLARLIMVDVNWYNWDLGEAACTQHDEFLRILLLEKSEAGQAWIHHDYGDQFRALAAHAAAGDYAAYRWLQDRLDPPSDKPEWIPGRLAGDAIARIAGGLLESCGLGEGDNRRHRDVVLPQLNLFASQIFLDGRRYNELAGLPAGTRDDYYVCVGSRFQFDLDLNRFVWFSALSAWSAWPWSRHHAPPPPDRSLCVADVNRGLHEFFWERLRGTLQAIIKQRLPELGTRCHACSAGAISRRPSTSRYRNAHPPRRSTTWPTAPATARCCSACRGPYCTPATCTTTTTPAACCRESCSCSAGSCRTCPTRAGRTPRPTSSTRSRTPRAT